MRYNFKTSLLALAATLVFLATPALAQKPDLDSEIAMGRRIAGELERKVTLIQDPIVTEYVNRLGQTIVRNSDAKVPFTPDQDRQLALLIHHAGLGTRG